MQWLVPSRPNFSLDSPNPLPPGPAPCRRSPPQNRQIRSRGASWPSQSRSQLLFFGPKRLQERPKRLARGFLTPSASKIRFGPHSGPILGVQNETPGLEKNIKILARVVKNQGFAVLSLVRFRAPIWGPPWAPLWGSIWPPGHSKPVSSAPLGRPRAGQD